MKERGTTSVHAPPEHRQEDPGICTDQAVYFLLPLIIP